MAESTPSGMAVPALPVARRLCRGWKQAVCSAPRSVPWSFPFLMPFRQNAHSRGIMQYLFEEKQ